MTCATSVAPESGDLRGADDADRAGRIQDGRIDPGRGDDNLVQRRNVLCPQRARNAAGAAHMQRIFLFMEISPAAFSIPIRLASRNGMRIRDSPGTGSGGSALEYRHTPGHPLSTKVMVRESSPGFRINSAAEPSRPLLPRAMAVGCLRRFCANPRLQWRDRCGFAPHSVFPKTGSSGPV